MSTLGVDERPVMAPDVALAGWQALAERDARLDWWEQLWQQAVALSARYRLGLRAGWWANPIQIETLATVAAWVGLFDAGVWTEPPVKLQLLFHLEQVRTLLRDGEQPFHPGRHRAEFDRYVSALLDSVATVGGGAGG